MQNSRTDSLSRAGVSIWLDDLSRDRIRGGGLQSLVAERNVVGITTNPTIFATALAASDAYDAQILDLARAGASVHETIAQLISYDVASACDILMPLYEASGGLDGRVSIEVSPAVAHDAAATLLEARDLFVRVDRPNAFIKIPATAEGTRAIEDATAEGLDVNVTLIFGLQRYREVIDAYLTGLERAHAAGIELSGIRSVASFFVSRVDVEVDRRLADIGTGGDIRSLAGIANARLAYGMFREVFGAERAQRLLALGANLQRPLWASTGVKDPALPDTRYVAELVADGVVNTMPAKTLEAFADHGEVRGDTISGALATAQATLDALDAAGVSFDDVTATLEREGIEKFAASWSQLADTVDAALARGGVR